MRNDILVLPNKYIEELRNMPHQKLSSIKGNIDVSISLDNPDPWISLANQLIID